MNIGAIIRSKRIEYEMKQEDLAAKVGVTQKAVSSWESGRTVPKIGELSQMSKIFNCTLAELTGTKEREIGDVTLEDILVRMISLDIGDLKEIYAKAGRLIQEKHEKELLIQERNEMMKERDRMTARLKEYERRIKNLEGRTDNA